MKLQPCSMFDLLIRNPTPPHAGGAKLEDEAMAGYDWSQGKSNNAVSAERDGLMVATAAAKWARQSLGLAGCTAKDIATVVPASEWHHTSKRFNRVNYYDSAEIEEAADELREQISTRKRNRKPGLLADVDIPLVNFSECGLPGDECVVRLKNGQLAAGIMRDFVWCVREITESELAAARKVWPCKGEIAKS